MINSFSMIYKDNYVSSGDQGASGVAVLRRDVRILENNLARAFLINEALWELMQKKLHLTEDDLNKKLYDIDMRDGQLDGKNQPNPSKCPNCNRPVSARHAACIYCGTVIDKSVFSIS